MPDRPQVDKDLLRFRRDAVRLGEAETGTPDCEDGVVDSIVQVLEQLFPTPCKPRLCAAAMCSSVSWR